MDKDSYSLPSKEPVSVPRLQLPLGKPSTPWRRSTSFCARATCSLRTHIAYKRENEIDTIRLRPHPYQFAFYFEA